MSRVLVGDKARLYIGGKLIGEFREFNVEETKKVVYVDHLVKTESSTNVASIAYQEVDKKVFVTFSNGGLYEYEDVEKEDFQALRDAHSVGKHLRAVFLKKNYRFHKLENSTITLDELPSGAIDIKTLTLTKKELFELQRKLFTGNGELRDLLSLVGIDGDRVDYEERANLFWAEVVFLNEEIERLGGQKRAYILTKEQKEEARLITESVRVFANENRDKLVEAIAKIKASKSVDK